VFFFLFKAMWSKSRFNFCCLDMAPIIQICGIFHFFLSIAYHVKKNPLQSSARHKFLFWVLAHTEQDKTILRLNI